MLCFEMLVEVVWDMEFDDVVDFVEDLDDV